MKEVGSSAGSSGTAALWVQPRWMWLLFNEREVSCWKSSTQQTFLTHTDCFLWCRSMEVSAVIRPRAEVSPRRAPSTSSVSRGTTSAARCGSLGVATGGGNLRYPLVCLSEGPNTNSGNRANDSMPSMATTAVGVSIFLLTTTACLVVKSRLYPCQSHSRRSSDQLDLMVDGLPVSLPSYEEAVYGSWGQRLPTCNAPGPTQLLLAQEAPPSESDTSRRPLLSGQSPDNPPPPYEEVQSSRPRDGLSGRDARHLHADKDT